MLPFHSCKHHSKVACYSPHTPLLPAKSGVFQCGPVFSLSSWDLWEVNYLVNGSCHLFCWPYYTSSFLLIHFTLKHRYLLYKVTTLCTLSQKAGNRLSVQRWSCGWEQPSIVWTMAYELAWYKSVWNWASSIANEWRNNRSTNVGWLIAECSLPLQPNVCSLNQWCKQLLGACQSGSISGPSGDLLSQNVHFKKNA